jgi:hypothetical protein
MARPCPKKEKKKSISRFERGSVFRTLSHSLFEEIMLPVSYRLRTSFLIFSLEGGEDELDESLTNLLFNTCKAFMQHIY